MLHLSLFLFFAGLAVFLWNVNLTIFKLVLSWIGLCTALYGCITFIPIFCHDSPYHTPLSLPVWHFTQGMRYLTFRALEWITLYIYYFCCVDRVTYYRFRRLAERYGKVLSRGMQKMAEESAFHSPPEIDTRAFMWTFDCLDEDHELERFFAGLPGFRGSKMVKDPLPDLTEEQQEKLLNALFGLSDHTSSSDLLPEAIKIRRTVICEKALGPEDISHEHIRRALRRIVSGDHYGLVKSADIVPFVRRWDSGKDGKTTMMIEAIVPSIIARAQRRDDIWFAMAADEMGVPESVLRSHVTHGNSLSLAILIWVVCKQYSLVWKRYWPQEEFSKVLEAASKFDVLDTSPELQHEFCALWNEVIHGQWHPYTLYVLRPIRNIYLMLHLHADCAPTQFSASTRDEDLLLENPYIYPLCNIASHHSHPATHVHDVPASTATPHPVLHDNAALDPTFPPDAPSHSVITPDPDDEYTVDVPQINNTLVLAPSSRAHQTATGDSHDSTTSPDPVAAVATRDDPPARTMAPTIRAASTPTTSVPSPAPVSFQNNADLLAPHSGSPEIPSLTSPEPVLENMLPTGTPPTLTISYLDLTDELSYPESHSSIMVNTSPRTSPWPASAPGPVAATSNEGSPKASSREDKDTPDLPSLDPTNQATTTAIVNVLPKLPPITDIVTASPSQQEFDVEHARDPL